MAGGGFACYSIGTKRDWFWHKVNNMVHVAGMSTVVWMLCELAFNLSRWLAILAAALFFLGLWLLIRKRQTFYHPEVGKTTEQVIAELPDK